MTEQQAQQLTPDCGKPELWRGGGTMMRPSEARAHREELDVRRTAKALAIAHGAACPECGFRHAPAEAVTVAAEELTGRTLGAVAASPDEGPKDDAKCRCGHTAHWHSHGGEGSCEHDGECRCPEFTYPAEIHAACGRSFAVHSEGGDCPMPRAVAASLVERVRSDDVRAGDRVWRDDEWQVVSWITWTDREGGYFSLSLDAENGRSWSASWISGVAVLRVVAASLPATTREGA